MTELVVHTTRHTDGEITLRAHIGGYVTEVRVYGPTMTDQDGAVALYTLAKSMLEQVRMKAPE